jgi:putative tricarboxylic transport membrane protein
VSPKKSMSKKAPDLIGAALLMTLGIAFAAGGTSYGVFGEGGRIGPGFMPFAAGSLLVLFGAMIGAEGLFRREAEPRDGKEASEDENNGEQGRSVRIAFGLMLVTILLIPVLGFLVSFGLLILALVTFVEREGWTRGILLSVGSVALTWVTFVLLLEIPLPTGFLGQLLGF